MGDCKRCSIWSKGADVVLRCFVTLLSTVSLMLLVRNQQSVAQQIGVTTVISDLKYSYVSGLVYLVYANGLVAVYCFMIALSSVSSIRTALHSNKPTAWFVFCIDQALAYILFSAASASAEVLYLARTGNEKAAWDTQCDIFGNFCHLLKISISISFCSVVSLALVAVLSAKHLFKHYTKVMFPDKMCLPHA